MDMSDAHDRKAGFFFANLVAEEGRPAKRDECCLELLFGQCYVP